MVVLPVVPPAAFEIAWNFLKATTDIAALRRFVAEFPGSAHRGEATARIAMLEPQAAEERRKADEERKKLAATAPPVPPAVPPRPAPVAPAVVAPPVVPPAASGPCGGGR